MINIRGQEKPGSSKEGLSRISRTKGGNFLNVGKKNQGKEVRNQK